MVVIHYCYCRWSCWAASTALELCCYWWCRWCWWCCHDDVILSIRLSHTHWLQYMHIGRCIVCLDWTTQSGLFMYVVHWTECRKLSK